MKRIIIAIFAVLPLCTMAQSEWTTPEDAKPMVKQDAKKEKAVKKNAKKDPKYLKGAAPMVDGRVEWTMELDIPGKSVQQIYDRIYQYMEELTHTDNQIKGSRVALVNKDEHAVITNVKEWLIFKQNAISLDRAATSYKLFAFCSDNHLKLTLTRIIFDYSENVPGDNGIYKAEEWIADETALNKKGTKIYPGSSRFRIKMIDRKDEIFNQVANLWK